MSFFQVSWVNSRGVRVYSDIHKRWDKAHMEMPSWAEGSMQKHEVNADKLSDAKPLLHTPTPRSDRG